MSDDQLSQHERTVLEVLEESLGLDDPAFVERFAADARALDARTGRRWSPRRWLHRRRNGARDL
jgi:Protein of unknown function (DUF3040)